MICDNGSTRILVTALHGQNNFGLPTDPIGHSEIEVEKITMQYYIVSYFNYCCVILLSMVKNVQWEYQEL